MSEVLRWGDLTRAELAERLPEAVVAVATGATEQHGPHLPTRTDALLAETVLEHAAELYRTRAGRDLRALILAPTLPYGASDHHLPFGGTLSLTPETLLSVLVDICRSLAADGGRRLLIVNGHGGNSGVCQAAAGAAAARFDLDVACLDYWAPLRATELEALPVDAVPGHAGAFETSLVSAVRPDLVSGPPARSEYAPNVPVPGLQVYSARVWAEWDGYTDSPGEATVDGGAVLLDRLAAALADRIEAFSAYGRPA